MNFKRFSYINFYLFVLFCLIRLYTQYSILKHVFKEINFILLLTVAYLRISSHRICELRTVHCSSVNLLLEEESLYSTVQLKLQFISMNMLERMHMHAHAYVQGIRV